MAQRSDALHASLLLSQFILLSSLIPESSEYNGSDEQMSAVSPFPKSRGVPASAASASDMALPYRRSLLWQKLRLCALHFDFRKEDQKAQREMKQTALLELEDVVKTMPCE